MGIAEEGSAQQTPLRMIEEPTARAMKPPTREF